jgi:type IV pilus assembly protein PilQ
MDFLYLIPLWRLLMQQKIMTKILLPVLILAAQDSTRLALPPAVDNVIIEELELNNAPIGEVLRLIASQYGINIFVDPNVDQRVSIFLQNASLRDVLTYLESEYRFDYDIKGDIVKVNPPRAPEPLFHIRFNQSDSLITVRVAAAPFGRVLDSLASALKHSFVYNGRLANEIVKVHLIDARVPDDLLAFLMSKGVTVERQGNLTVLRDLEADEQGMVRTRFRRNIEVSGRGIRVQVNNEAIAGLIAEVARESNINTLIYSPPPGNISLNVSGLDFADFLNLVLNGTGYTFRRKNEVYLIGDTKIHGIQSTAVLKLEHLKVDGITANIPEHLLRQAEIKEIKEHNSLSITAFPDIISDIRDYLQRIDREIPQVLIEAIVVDFDVTDSWELGIDGGLSDRPLNDTTGIYQVMPGADILFKGKISQEVLDNIMGSFGSAIKITKLPDNFYLNLRALETLGKANIKSKPHIATLNGHAAELNIGVTQYYKLRTNNYYGGYYPQTGNNQQGNTGFFPSETERFEKIEAVVSLKLTPWISGDDEITVEINPDFQTPVTQLNPEVPPTIQSRTIKSTVRLKDGETIILGGLIQEIESEQTQKTPILGDIPLLGWLFRSTSKSKQKKEMIIYITPHLYREQQSGLDAYTNIRFAP